MVFGSVVDPDPDPVVDTVPIWILLPSSKNSKKNADSYCFVTSLSLKNYVSVASKST
jgi:hypothetical protein